MSYLVQSGDTFGAIARKLGITIAALRAANPGLTDIDRLRVGQRLAVPPSVAEAAFPTTGEGVNPLPRPTPEATADAPLAWGARVSPEFRAKVRTVAARIGCDPSDLMACMAFESGESFSASIRNARSGATGLIQFMPTTATKLGTSTAELALMTPEAQLDYVARYFTWFPGIRTLEDLYMAILWPRAIGKPNDYVLFAIPSVAYRQNAGLDKDGDGRVTKAEAAASVRAKLAKGLKPAFCA